jgi:alpha,alpha-trehalase
MVRRISPLLLVIVFGFGLLVAPSFAQTSADVANSEQRSLEPILHYISHGWDALTRSQTKCETLGNPKSAQETVLYLPVGFSIPSHIQELAKNCRVRLEHLPEVKGRPGAIDVGKIHPHGLLYLENPYVVPGGFFNEMYGWDSYFILLGLLREGKVELARGMVENFFFEIEHYGMVLNANRTYFLTRSQPPFLTSMILAVYQAAKAKGKDDVAWLAKGYRYAVKDYEHWVRKPHLAGTTGLSRYFDHGEGAAPEILAGTDPYYRYAAGYFLQHPDVAGKYLARAIGKDKAPDSIGPVFPVHLCNPGGNTPQAETCEPVEQVWLTAEFYKGDRSMRESGFDISHRFGPLSGSTQNYAAVCLNSLLYKTEKDLERISFELGRPAEAAQWRERAVQRRERMNRYFWDGARGLYFDYNFKAARRSSYEYATTFYPLWAGLATLEQARTVARNLAIFEQPGGLAMSRRETKAQWDYPYGWAPVQLIAVEGLRRYGFRAEANRISYKFLSMVLQNFRTDHTIREKYNVVTRSSETQVEAGYKENVIGFGWTNGVFLELLHFLPKEMAGRLGRE